MLSVEETDKEDVFDFVYKIKEEKTMNPRKACIDSKWFDIDIKNPNGDHVCFPKMNSAENIDIYGNTYSNPHQCNLWNQSGYCIFFVNKYPWYKKIFAWLGI